jgi:DNA-binding NtrC family response regulator
MISGPFQGFSNDIQLKISIPPFINTFQGICNYDNTENKTVNRVNANRDMLPEKKSFRPHLVNDAIEHPEAFHDILTQDKEMLRIFKDCELIAPGSATVLITGASGTGKELIARALHYLSGRKGDFVTVNIAGLDDTMFSDTLFGHMKGAFTGAINNRNGLVEKAYGGTLFLDEIGDLEPPSQVKLLRLIQEKEYYKSGSDLLHKAETRIITATNADLNEKRETNKFRMELYYRLTHKIHLPPLIERKVDLNLLISHFLKKAKQEYQKNDCFFSEDALSLLATYKYPGNIRELEAIITDAVACCREKIIDAPLIKKNLDYSAIDAKVIFPEVLPTIKEIVDLLVKEALQRTGENQSQAGRLIGCSHEAIRKRLKKL